MLAASGVVERNFCECGGETFAYGLAGAQESRVNTSASTSTSAAATNAAMLMMP